MNGILKLSSLALVLGAAAASAADFRPLTQRCEEALALSALPAALRDRASVYVWKDGAFAKTIASDGGFHCVVERNHPDAIIPECVTSTGEHSILAAIMLQTKLTAEGMPAESVAKKAREMIASGELAAPSGPGVNYMMSAYNLIYSPERDEIGHFGPHTMFFAPDASSEVVGGSYQMARATPGFPFVVEAGSHSYIVSFTQNAAETDDVRTYCKGQIDLTPFADASD